MLAPTGLATIIKGRFFNKYKIMAVGSILVELPSVVLFFLLQKQFISGLTMGATKG
jgi:multiple sugar transport system permease protein|tara:strand:- start:216 stop:383 length:168 start_codon:yes stop_codon:yes gene_type:complete